MLFFAFGAPNRAILQGRTGELTDTPVGQSTPGWDSILLFRAEIVDAFWPYQSLTVNLATFKPLQCISLGVTQKVYPSKDGKYGFMSKSL